ncbi:hypothetical protein [Accumulibacter sp.]|jgi:hypothetical protein|uniref:Uncharacterized protein n=1 Tax=Accumulibacter regalis TaxID=522306 RepID=C7RRV8_ACCRE|nr:hypothetical protein [Accumulibacter sp.]
MSKERATIGSDGVALPVLPPERDARVCARLVRVMFYTPGFLALLLLKAGEPTSFGISVELLMLSSVAAIVAGLFISAQSTIAGSDHSSRVGTWSGMLILELLSVVSILCAIPSVFHELANSRLLHALAPGAVDVALGASELLPAVAVIPFILYQLAGFGILHYILPKPMNWAINLAILGLIVVATAANRRADYGMEKATVSVLVIAMLITVFFGVLKLRQMQTTYDTNCPAKEPKEKDAE